MRTDPGPSIDDILRRTDLAALLDQVANPAGSARGRRWHCPVPDHADSNASVTMHTDARGHERWRCWSGDDNHRGDAIDLVMITRGLDRAGAIRHLADHAGLHRDDTPTRPPRPAPRTAGPRPLDPLVVDYVTACEKILHSRSMQPARDWLHARGFFDEVLRANHVGADPGRELLHRRRGLPRGDSLAVTFPALNPHGAIRYVQTRYLDPGADQPKYDNPASHLGTNPRLAWTVLVGDPRPGVLVVCEGIPDALTAAQAGYRAAAVLGAQSPDLSVATRLVTYAERHDLEITAVIDADLAGRQWGQRLGDLVTNAGADLHLLEPPADGLDLNDWAQQDPTWHTWLPPPTPEVELDTPAIELPSR